VTRGSSPDPRAKALAAACGAGDAAASLACIAALLDGGADLAQRSGFPPAPPLQLAALGGRRDVVDRLVAAPTGALGSKPAKSAKRPTRRD